LSSFSEAAPRTGQDKPGASEVVALAQDEVGGEIAGRPRGEESRCLGSEFVEQALSCARSAASKSGPAISPECSQ
jgi:hypothetical protein